MKILTLTLAFCGAGCLPPLANPPPGTPAQIIEQCGADAAIHNGGVFSTVGLTVGSLGVGVVALSLPSPQDNAAIRALGVAGAAAGALALGDVIVTAIEGKKYVDDGCAAITGPLPYNVRRPANP